MHLSAPRNRYMHTTASKGRMLQKKATVLSKRGAILRCRGQADMGRPRPRDPRPQLPLHERHHVHEARRADHGLVGEDGLHRLLHTIIRLQRGQEGLDFFPEKS